MGAQARHERLAELIEPVLAAAGLELESVDVTPAGKRRLLRVVVDADPDANTAAGTDTDTGTDTGTGTGTDADTARGADLDSIGVVSQEISATLDASDVMGESPYVLEVTSPGVDRPLTHPRHWRRSRGRLVHAHLVDGGEVTGRVVAVDEAGVTFEVDGRNRVYGYSDLGRGQVQVEFRRDSDNGAAD